MEKPKYILDFEKPLRELTLQLENLKQLSTASHVDVAAEIATIEQKIHLTQTQVYKNLTPWQRVQLARHPQRPYSLDFIKNIFTDFQELHGDRLFKDDQAIVGGTALLEGKPVMVIGQQKGRNTKENLARNFGSPNPEGYRKAMRLMRLAEKFRMPVICFIDTPGAYPGIGSEERHVAEAIAVNIREMSCLQTPIVAIVIGEGGSGGALGVGVADRVFVLENAYYSVISPEGCAAILWKDRVHAPKAAEALKLNAKSLIDLGVADGIIEEPLGGAHVDFAAVAKCVKEVCVTQLDALGKLNLQTLLDQRYAKYRAMGSFQEIAVQ